MKHLNSTLLKYLLSGLTVTILVCVAYVFSPVNSQTRRRTVTASVPPNQTSALSDEVVKVDVDLVTVDALVLQKQTARMVGGLKKEDFILLEDGNKQEVTLFGQDNLPLSVLLLIDRGGCLDPFSTEVHKAALAAVLRLKPTDEVAVMSYHDTPTLMQEFTRDRALVSEALDRLPKHEEEADHCLNTAFAEAADYVQKAGNPIGRRVIITITGVTRNFDCKNGPSGKAAARAIYESGAVVCGIIPKTGEQKLENGIMTWATRLGKLGGAAFLDIQTLANETGGEILKDKPEFLNTTFTTLMDHLRSRYQLAFVSSNKKRDGGTRKLKIETAPGAGKSQGKLVVKARKSYVAPR